MRKLGGIGFRRHLTRQPMTVNYPATHSEGRSTSLSRILAIASLLATLAGMLVYTAFGYVAGEPASLAEFTTHHLIPALLIGITVCATLSFFLHAKLIAPVKEIFAHLYRVGSGQFSPLTIDTHVSEIRTIVEGINLLVSRLKGAAGDGALEKALDSLVKLRSDLEAAAANADDSADALIPVMRDLRNLEGELLSAMQTATPGR